MKVKKSLEQEINEFLEKWDADQMCQFLRDLIPLYELYDVDEDKDWVKEAVGEDDERTVRLIRTVYLVSRIAEFHAAMLCSIKLNFKNLYARMERQNLINVQEKVE